MLGILCIFGLIGFGAMMAVVIINSSKSSEQEYKAKPQWTSGIQTRKAEVKKASTTERLIEAKQLFERELITEDEFNNLKKRIIEKDI